MIKIVPTWLTLRPRHLQAQLGRRLRGRGQAQRRRRQDDRRHQHQHGQGRRFERVEHHEDGWVQQVSFIYIWLDN